MHKSKKNRTARTARPCCAHAASKGRRPKPRAPRMRGVSSLRRSAAAFSASPASSSPTARSSAAARWRSACGAGGQRRGGRVLQYRSEHRSQEDQGVLTNSSAAAPEESGAAALPPNSSPRPEAGPPPRAQQRTGSPSTRRLSAQRLAGMSSKTQRSRMGSMMPAGGERENRGRAMGRERQTAHCVCAWQSSSACRIIHSRVLLPKCTCRVHAAARLHGRAPNGKRAATGCRCSAVLRSAQRSAAQHPPSRRVARGIWISTAYLSCVAGPA